MLRKGGLPCLSLVVIALSIFGFVNSDLVGSVKHRTEVSLEDVGKALYCMEGQKGLKSLKSDYGGDFYRVRYLYGVVDPRTDRPDELHLVTYRVNHTAWLYEFLIRKDGQNTECVWVNSAQLYEIDGKWRVKETLGGDYSYHRVSELANLVARSKEIHIPFFKKPPSNLKCEGN